MERQTEALTIKETRQLEEFEQTIAKGWETFIKVGVALKAIRDQKLYRGSYTTFEKYCEERFDFGRDHAYRLIEAATVCEDLESFDEDSKPTSEYQLRPLVGLDPEERVAVWREALEAADGRSVTGKLVREMVAEHIKSGGGEPKDVRRTTVISKRTVRCVIDEVLAALEEGNADLATETLANLREKLEN